MTRAAFHQAAGVIRFGDDDQLRCPPAKHWAPFVRGCVPENSDPGHDKGRLVRSCQRVLVTRSDVVAISQRWSLFVPSPMTVGLFFARDVSTVCHSNLGQQPLFDRLLTSH